MTYYFSMDQVKRAHQAAGGYFFSRGAMRGFHTRLGSTVYGGRYFITSEQMAWNTPRRYAIREIHESGDITTVGQVLQYGTWQEARREIAKLIVGKPE